MGLMLGHRNHADAATLSGGSWDATFPLNNMKSLPIKKVARTTALPAFSQQTLFMADIGAGQVVDLFCLFGLSVPDGTQFNVIGSNSSSLASAYIYSASAGSALYFNYKEPSFVLPIPSVEARYWFLQVTLPTATTVDIGRLYIGEAWKPELGHDFGSQVGVESTTLVQSSLSGVDFFDRRPNRRTKQVKFSWLNEVETYQGVLDIQRRLDVSGEVVVCDDDLIKMDITGAQWALLGATVSTEAKSALWTPFGRVAPSYLAVNAGSVDIHGLTAQPKAHALNQKLTVMAAVRRRTHSLYCALRISVASYTVQNTRVVFSYADGGIGSKTEAPGWKIMGVLSKQLNDGWFLIGMHVLAPLSSVDYRVFSSITLAEDPNGPDQYTPAITGHTMYYSGLGVFEGHRSALYPGAEQAETYMARMRQLSPIEYPYLDTHSAAFDFVEVV